MTHLCKVNELHIHLKEGVVFHMVFRAVGKARTGIGIAGSGLVLADELTEHLIGFHIGGAAYAPVDRFVIAIHRNTVHIRIRMAALVELHKGKIGMNGVAVIARAEAIIQRKVAVEMSGVIIALVHREIIVNIKARVYSCYHHRSIIADVIFITLRVIRIDGRFHNGDILRAEIIQRILLLIVGIVCRFRNRMRMRADHAEMFHGSGRYADIEMDIIVLNVRIGFVAVLQADAVRGSRIARYDSADIGIYCRRQAEEHQPCQQKGGNTFHKLIYLFHKHYSFI